MNPAHSDFIARYTEENITVNRLKEIYDQNPGITAAILCSTRLCDPDIEEFLSSNIQHFIYLDGNTPTPLKNRYATPSTLGPDRLAAAVGAATIAPGEDLLVVDFGSAITIDSVSAAGEYLGGNISPGMAMRYKALHELTDKLPLCPEPYTPSETSDNTLSAISNGVAMGIVFEIEGYLARYVQAGKNPKVFFTGRDAFYFADKLKNTIFADCDLVLKGLNRIIEYNA